MGNIVPEFYEKNHFFKVIPLHATPNLQWEELKKEMHALPRGWYELSQLSNDDRIEFTLAYWLAKLPFFSTLGFELENQLIDFFGRVDEIGVFATQLKAHSPFEFHMIYSLKGEEDFFHASPPASQEVISTLCKQFGHLPFPPDFLAFLEIHDGFCKVTDTGLIHARDMARVYQHLQRSLSHEIILTSDGHVINPSSLIPFYESSGLHCYQCFYTDWCPEGEMGNVFLSEADREMSSFSEGDLDKENLAFPTFTDWLVFYVNTQKS